MSYIINKYAKGEIKFRGLVAGWYFPKTDEFRPLMADAMMELFLNGWVDADIVYETAQAREKHAEEVLANYKPEPYTNEEIYEMKAAFDDHEDVADIFTGDIIHLADY